jgi:hypothetical protein
MLFRKGRKNEDAKMKEHGRKDTLLNHYSVTPGSVTPEDFFSKGQFLTGVLLSVSSMR